MSLLYIIKETFLMMGFTFIVGIAFAYVLKLMTIIIPGLSGKELSRLARRSRVWGYAYRIDTARAYHYIRSITCLSGLVVMGHNVKIDKAHTMDDLAEYHFGNSSSATAANQDSEMKQLYELHNGEI